MIYKSPDLLPEEDLALLVKQYQLGVPPSSLSLTFNVEEKPLIKYLRDIPMKSSTMTTIKKGESNVKMSLDQMKEGYERNIAVKQKLIESYEKKISRVVHAKIMEYLESDFEIKSIKELNMLNTIFRKVLQLDNKQPTNSRQDGKLSFRRIMSKQPRDGSVIDVEVVENPPDLEIMD